MIKATTAPYAALLLRVTLGMLFLAHVGLESFVVTIPGLWTVALIALFLLGDGAMALKPPRCDNG